VAVAAAAVVVVGGVAEALAAVAGCVPAAVFLHQGEWDGQPAPVWERAQVPAVERGLVRDLEPRRDQVLALVQVHGRAADRRLAPGQAVCLAAALDKAERGPEPDCPAELARGSGPARAAWAILPAAVQLPANLATS